MVDRMKPSVSCLGACHHFSHLEKLRCCSTPSAVLAGAGAGCLGRQALPGVSPLPWDMPGNTFPGSCLSERGNFSQPTPKSLSSPQGDLSKWRDCAQSKAIFAWCGMIKKHVYKVQETAEGIKLLECFGILQDEKCCIHVGFYYYNYRQMLIPSPGFTNTAVPTALHLAE